MNIVSTGHVLFREVPLMGASNVFNLQKVLSRELICVYLHDPMLTCSVRSLRKGLMCDEIMSPTLVIQSSRFISEFV